MMFFIGTMFYIMRHVPGRGFWDPRMPGLAADERAATQSVSDRHPYGPRP